MHNHIHLEELHYHYRQLVEQLSASHHRSTSTTSNKSNNMVQVCKPLAGVGKNIALSPSSADKTEYKKNVTTFFQEAKGLEKHKIIESYFEPTNNVPTK